MLPIDVTAELGKTGGYLAFLLLGMGFGASLELAGFGDSRRLAAQFYFKDMTVLKTMFTGIITASILIFLASALGWLDFSQIAVNQTYLWPGIVGGLVMGVGFVIGGYCPGTSVVSAASLKADGIAFFVGTILGAGVFGETVSSYYDFWHSSFTDRWLLSDWLGWSLGATVVGVTLLALAMFYGAEKVEAYVRFRSTGEPFSWKVKQKGYLFGAGALLSLAILTWAIGQPDPDRKWELVRSRYESLLSSRDVFIHPLEYVKTWNDSSIKLVTLDLRSPEEFAKFRLDGARATRPEDLLKADFVASLLQLPAHGLVILVSDDEATVVRAWQRLKAQGVANLYILDGGLRNWGQLFTGIGSLHESFDLSRPPARLLQQFPKDSFPTKIKLKTNQRSGGLCS